MRVGPAPGVSLGELTLEGSDLPGIGAAAAIKARNGGRGAGELAAQGGERTLRLHQLALDAGKLGARGGHALGDRSLARKHTEEALLERDPALLGGGKLGLAPAQFLIEEAAFGVSLRSPAKCPHEEIGRF